MLKVLFALLATLGSVDAFRASQESNVTVDASRAARRRRTWNWRRKKTTQATTTASTTATTTATTTAPPTQPPRPRRRRSTTATTTEDPGHCQFKGSPHHKFYWDESCKPDGGKGCHADGKNMACRFCGNKFGWPCPGEKPPAASEKAKSGNEKYLKIVDEFLLNHKRNPNSLLQTYGPGNIGGGDCGSTCKLSSSCPGEGGCRFDVYDNSLVAIWFTHRGLFKEAKKILDGFRYLLYPGHNHHHATKESRAGRSPSGRPLTLLAAAYTEHGSKPGQYGRPHTSWAGEFIDTGNNAFAAIAFARYAAATGDRCYATIAHDIMHALRTMGKCDDHLGGFMGRHHPTTTFYRSVEHNIDMVALARMLNLTEDQKSASTFVSQMWYQGRGTSYAIGTGNSGRCDARVRAGGPVPVDGVVWNIAASADESPHVEEHYSKGMKQTLRPKAHGGMWEQDTDSIGGKDGKGRGDKYWGVRFSNHGNGIQLEVSASTVVAMIEYKRRFGTKGIDVTDYLQKGQDSIKRLLKVYGSVPASVLGGNVMAYWKRNHGLPHPGGADTGLGWNYMRYPHLAATVWTGFALGMQSTADGPVVHESNPYAAPLKPVPPPRKWAITEQGHCAA